MRSPSPESGPRPPGPADVAPDAADGDPTDSTTSFPPCRTGEVDAGSSSTRANSPGGTRASSCWSISACGGHRRGRLPLPSAGTASAAIWASDDGWRSRLFAQSIEYSLEHREEALDYALEYGRGLDRDKADRFVGMYVNDLTVDYGERGKQAMSTFLDRAFGERLIPRCRGSIFCKHEAPRGDRADQGGGCEDAPRHCPPTEMVADRARYCWAGNVAEVRKGGDEPEGEPDPAGDTRPAGRL